MLAMSKVEFSGGSNRKLVRRLSRAGTGSITSEKPAEPSSVCVTEETGSLKGWPSKL
jgi:hypothetical protein